MTQTRICFAIAAGEVETLFHNLILLRFLSSAVIRIYSLKTQYRNSISTKGEGKKKAGLRKSKLTGEKRKRLNSVIK